MEDSAQATEPRHPRLRGALALVPTVVDRRQWLRGVRPFEIGTSILGAIAVLAHVVWMWIGRFHSQDGPAHMFATRAWQHLRAGDAGALADVYTLNFDPDPNWLTYPILSTWLRAYPARVAELALVTMLVIGLAGGLYYAVTARRGTAGPVAVAGFAVAIGWSVHTGLYNFTASVALLLVIAGYVLRIGGVLTVRRAVMIALLLVLLYFSHPLSLVAAYLVVGVVGLIPVAADPDLRRSWRRLSVHVAGLLVVALPSAVLLLGFLADPGTVRPRDNPHAIAESLAGTLLFRWPIQVVRGDVAWTVVLALATWAVVAALVARKIARRDWGRWDLLLVVPLITGSSAVVLPDRLAGGTLVQPRLAIYTLLTLLLWIAIANGGTRFAQWLGVGLGIVGTVVMFGLLAMRVEPYRQMDAAVDEVLTAADGVAPDGLVLAAVSSRAEHFSPVVPLVHIANAVAMEADAVPISTLDAGSGYGPIRYRERFDPDPALRGYPGNRTHGRDLIPTQFKNTVRRYEQVTGRSFDYVLLIAYDLRPAELQDFADMGFRLVQRTEPDGLAHVFEVTPSVLSVSGANPGTSR
jgi:hypothetical protein